LNISLEFIKLNILSLGYPMSSKKIFVYFIIWIPSGYSGTRGSFISGGIA